MASKVVSKVENKDEHFTHEVLIIAVLMVLLVLAIDLLFYPQTLDDAFIAFRYSQHLAEGYGFGAWNTTGEKVEGYTSFLWMLMIAIAEPLNLQTATLAKVFGIASHLALSLLYLFFPLIHKSDLATRDTPLGQHRDVFIFASIILAFYLPLSWYSSTGMETITFVLLVSLSLLAPLLTEKVILIIIIQVALVLMRPEGILFAVACNALHLLRRWQAKQLIRPVLLGIVAAIAAFLALTVFRLVVFGQVFPNTYYAKFAGAGNMHVVHGIRYVAMWIYYHQLWSFILCLTVCFCILSLYRKGLRKNLSLVFLLVFVVCYTFYIVKIGGDNNSPFPYWRHILHLMPFLSLLLATGLVNMIPEPRPMRFVLFIITLLAVNCQIIYIQEGRMLKDITSGMKHYPTLTHAPHNEYYLWMAQITDSNTVIASSLGGEFPFVVGAVHIDILGLSDSHIAHYGHFDPVEPIDSKTDMAYVLERRPDIIEGYISGQKIVKGIPGKWIVNSRFRGQMHEDLLNNPIFQTEYLFLVDGPYKYLDRAIFIRRSYWANHPLSKKLRCVPVTATSIYKP